MKLDHGVKYFLPCGRGNGLRQTKIGVLQERKLEEIVLAD